MQDLKLTDINLTLPKDCPVETLVGQLQAYTPKLLYVLDGITIGYYSDLSEVPPGKRELEPASPSSTLVQHEFYIRDLTQEQLICCFDERLKDRLLGPPDSADTISITEDSIHQGSILIDTPVHVAEPVTIDE
jgi:hypothetical protein